MHSLPPSLPLIRRARAADQAQITRLVRSERLNPCDLAWPRFCVAAVGERIVGAVQLRWHDDGSRELGSLVVAPPWRGRGIAARLIAACLEGHDGTVHVITARVNAAHYRRWRFHAIDAVHAPRAVRSNHLMGRLAGLVGLLRGRRPRPLVVLERPVPQTAPSAARPPRRVAAIRAGATAWE